MAGDTKFKGDAPSVDLVALPSFTASVVARRCALTVLWTAVLTLKAVLVNRLRCAVATHTSVATANNGHGTCQPHGDNRHVRPHRASRVGNRCRKGNR